MLTIVQVPKARAQTPKAPEKAPAQVLKARAL